MSDPRELVPVTLAVTPADLAAGVPGACRECAAALALRRLLRPDVSLAVFADRFHVNGRPYTCPPALREFVGLFDQGYACSPLTVEVRVERGAVRTEGS